MLAVTEPVVRLRTAEAPAPKPSPTVINPLELSDWATTATEPSWIVRVPVATVPVRVTVIAAPLTTVLPKGPVPDQLPEPVKFSVPVPAV